MFLEQHIRMISEESCDTEDWSNDAENTVLITGINTFVSFFYLHQILKYSFYIVIILKHYCFTVFLIK